MIRPTIVGAAIGRTGSGKPTRCSRQTRCMPAWGRAGPTGWRPIEPYSARNWMPRRSAIYAWRWIRGSRWGIPDFSTASNGQQDNDAKPGHGAGRESWRKNLPGSKGSYRWKFEPGPFFLFYIKGSYRWKFE